MTIVEFLLAQLDGEEVAAQRVVDEWRKAGRGLDQFEKYILDPVIGPFGGQSPLRNVAAGLYLVRFGHPARVLAQVAAVRRVVEEHQEKAPGVCSVCSRHDYPCPTLRALASTYADHPDYQQEWTL